MGKIVLMVCLLLCATAASAQNLSEMPEAERNKLLLGAAKEAVREYAPDYVKYTSGEYEVQFIAKNIPAGFKNSLYVVKFIEYDREEEYFMYGYAVSADFLADSGKLWCVRNGHGLGKIMEEFLPPGVKFRVLEYKRVPPREPKARSDGKIWSD